MAKKLENLQRVVDSITAATLLFDESLKLTFINQAGELLFGVSAPHLLGLRVDELIRHEAPLLAELEQAMTTGHPFTSHEMAVTLIQGNEEWMDISAIPLIDPGELPGMLLEITPINRLLRIARDENRLSQQDATREILRGLAHEIKNPLGGLRGAAQLLEKQLESAELKEYTGVIINEADRLQKLLNRILGPNTLPDKHELNIHEVLERVRSVVSVEAGEGIRLRRDYDPSIPEFRADLDQLVQAILNIVRNAVQAMGDKGEVVLKTRVERKFSIGQNCHKLVARINIEDTGAGVPDDLKEKIFFPMVTGRAEGTGLGLSIAQSIIERHGGVIECKSEPGHTVFSILIPIESRE